MPVSLLERLAPALSHDFLIERQLGTGAMATVYLAHDLKHDRPVALKALRPEVALAIGSERFLQEIHTAARLSHPGILPVLDSGEVDGLLYFTMPFVDGESLRQLLRRSGPLPLPRVLRITQDVAAALGCAHGQGVIHRDIKPENILLQDDRALLADFGLALALGESESIRLTQSGVAVGTPQYMSPEQSLGSGSIDQRSDIYSLACIVYEMLAGEPLFSGGSAHVVLQKHIAEAPPSLRRRRPDLPVSVISALEQALAKPPAERFATAEAFAAAMEDPSRRLRRRPLSRRWRWGGAVVAAALASAAALTLTTHARPTVRDRDWVLVADFDGPPSDPPLRRVVRELLTTELNQSRRLGTMPRAQLVGTVRAAGLPETTTVNLDLARELAFRSAIRAVIGGRIDESGSAYTLTVRAIDAADGRQLASASGSAVRDSLVPLIGRLGRSILRDLGERKSDLAANHLLLDIATPSLPAYRRYVDALRRKEVGDVTGSTRLLHQAIELDSSFAAAFALMGVIYLESRNMDSARIAIASALRFPGRLTPAQSFRLRGDAAYTSTRTSPERSDGTIAISR